LYTSDETENLILVKRCDEIVRAIRDLKQGTFTKIICGAANTNAKQVERLAMVYALSGVNMIDISPSKEIAYAAKKGLARALDLHTKEPELYSKHKEPVLMVSLDSGDDVHFRKAEIDYNLCTKCNACLEVCPANAISHAQSEVITISKKNCFGCGKCAKACPSNSINYTKLACEIDGIDGIKAVEIHTANNSKEEGNNSVKEVQDFLSQNERFISSTELLSFCVSSKRFSPAELITYVKALTELVAQKVIIQIDGVPMGTTEMPYSSLQTLSSAAILLESNTNAYIQLSGGTNYFTKRLVKKLGLNISGIGYGTFARKIILSYIDELDDAEFLSELQRILNITTSLVEN
jgi:Fe-S-cluster-containing hydrogenase component 2